MNWDKPPQDIDVAIIGGGQAGLATAYFLRRTQLSFVVLDAEEGPGAAWRHGWDSLTLFSPSRWSSLPGWPMPAHERYPTRDQVIDYFSRYEARYALPVIRPVNITTVQRSPGGLIVQADDQRQWHAQHVVSATGTWRHPSIPHYPDRSRFAGRQLHSAEYRSPGPFADQRVLVVGGGNSGAQIMAEVAPVAQARWVTPTPPRFLPEGVDGDVLFERASVRWRALQQGLTPPPAPGDLADIVLVPPVSAARARGHLEAVRPFQRFTETGVIWPDGTHTEIDTVIWCTGFRPALHHLSELDVVEPTGRVAVNGTRSMKEPALWLVGYGEWTGFASATLVGVMRSARTTAQEIGRVTLPGRPKL